MENKEYVIINKTAIQQRIEELKKPIAHYDGIYVSDAQIAEYETLEELLSQSTPLIPILEKAFEIGRKSGGSDAILHTNSKQKDFEQFLNTEVNI